MPDDSQAHHRVHADCIRAGHIVNGSPKGPEMDRTDGRRHSEDGTRHAIPDTEDFAHDQRGQHSGSAESEREDEHDDR